MKKLNDILNEENEFTIKEMTRDMILMSDDIHNTVLTVEEKEKKVFDDKELRSKVKSVYDTLNDIHQIVDKKYGIVKSDHDFSDIDDDDIDVDIDDEEMEEAADELLDGILEDLYEELNKDE